jgi:hypothetical protein
MSIPDGFERVGVDLPKQVGEIVKAAGGEDHLPRALATLIGAMATLAVVLHRTLPRDEYVAFARAVTDHLNTAKAIINSDDPDKAYRDEARRQNLSN